MTRYLIRRILHGAVLLVVVMVVTFTIFNVLGDPVRRILPVNATDEQVQAFSDAQGFSDPVPTRLLRFASDAASGTFGESYTTGDAALPTVLEALPNSLVLTASAVAISLTLGLALGVVGAVNRGGRIDRMVVASSVTFVSIAEFWLGLMLITLFSVQLGLLPTGGYGLDEHLILPAVTLALVPLGRIAFLVRNVVSNALDEEHVVYARAMGLSKTAVLRRHVLRNIWAPVIALTGVEGTHILVGGALVVETVFAWPGIGRLYALAMLRYDLPLVTAALFVATAIILFANIMFDLVYARLDPRIRYR